MNTRMGDAPKSMQGKRLAVLWDLGLYKYVENDASVPEWQPTAEEAEAQINGAKGLQQRALTWCSNLVRIARKS